MARPVALAYHAVTGAWPHPLAIAPDLLRAQLRRLAGRGLRGVTIDEYVRDPGGGAVAITFDDGFASVRSAAKPVLDELGWRATVFAVTDSVGSREPMLWLGGSTLDYAAERLPLTWSELQELSAAGWEIGSHSRTHRLLSTLSDDDLDDELAGSKAAVEAYGLVCTSISYPFGELEDRVVAASRRAGYLVGSGLAGRFRRDDAMRVPRVAIDGSDNHLRFAVKTSAWFALGRSTPLWDLLERARRPGRPLGI